MTKIFTKSTYLGAGVALLFLACSPVPQEVSEPQGPTKEALKQGKGDSTLWAKECTRLGYPADCDICQVKGYYLDAECDTFCPTPDPICTEDPYVVNETNCDLLDAGIADCVYDGISVEECTADICGDAESLAFAHGCCNGFGYDFCEYLPPEGCAPVTCEIYCTAGFQRDAQGCEICRCIEVKDVEGTVHSVFMGEMDPFVVGDVCVLFVDTQDQGLVGLLEDIDYCEYTAALESSTGAKVFVSSSDLYPITNAEQVEVLNDYELATYYDLQGSVNLVP